MAVRRLPVCRGEFGGASRRAREASLRGRIPSAAVRCFSARGRCPRPGGRRSCGGASWSGGAVGVLFAPRRLARSLCAGGSGGVPAGLGGVPSVVPLRGWIASAAVRCFPVRGRCALGRVDGGPATVLPGQVVRWVSCPRCDGSRAPCVPGAREVSRRAWEVFLPLCPSVGGFLPPPCGASPHAGGVPPAGWTAVQRRCSPARWCCGRPVRAATARRLPVCLAAWGRCPGRTRIPASVPAPQAAPPPGGRRSSGGAPRPDAACRHRRGVRARVAGAGRRREPGVTGARFRNRPPPGRARRRGGRPLPVF
ncbi:hypothetical protein SSCG_03343 [Streptomyces clavuligerus]|nr:hypothetical protein SSCG_03343 [Streptomyces clavuligerus]